MIPSCVQSGSGELGTVVALHSLGLDAAAFTPLGHCLGQGWRLITFDQLGHGTRALTPPTSFEALVDDAVAVVETQQAGPVHLLGHSMGGAVAALATARADVRIASLTLVATPPMGLPAFVERGEQALRGGMENAIETTLARWFGAGEEDDVAHRYATRSLRRMTPAGYAACWRVFASFGGYRELVAKLPSTLLLAMANDISTPPSALTEIADSFYADSRGADIEMVTLPNSGHMGPLTHPAALAEVLTSYWRRCSCLAEAASAYRNKE
ncbi:alpha/beta fold hydrolase [Salinicola sp. MIT1003]|uniref:alpha/beta fold hydrolase n=1 Tax=Salinicola sp. MIT1003 TaxID=1882734 RepID=UPI0008DD0378|nr:alpha/beta fold hydrolase [Salinicola sp. MIT1003]OHZ01613.1 hypothetical protein BC443_11325 [Salinicola sp. MIT1003]